MNLENHMVVNLNKDLDRFFGEPTRDEIEADRQRIEDEINALWLKPDLVSEAISECPEFTAFHNLLLEGDTAQAGAVIEAGISRYFRNMVEEA